MLQVAPQLRGRSELELLRAIQAGVATVDRHGRVVPLARGGDTFPYSISLLDDFNRGSLGANWSRMGGWSADIAITGSTQLTGPASYGGNYWNAATFGPDMAAYITLALIGSDEFYFHFRLQSPSTTGIDGYILLVTTNTSPHGWRLYRLDNNTATPITSTVNQNIANGDKVGWEAVGSTIKGWLYSGGTWTQIISATDATYGSAGNIGIGIGTNNAHLDDLYVGTVAAGPPPSPEGFIIPNEADATFADQAEPDAQDFAILRQAFARCGVVTGCQVTAQGSPNMTVAVEAGSALVDDASVSVSSGNVTITTADGSNPRFDLIAVDDAGAKSAIPGTPSANPVFPEVPLSTTILAAVYVPAGDTAITDSQIVDKRVFLI